MKMIDQAFRFSGRPMATKKQPAIRWWQYAAFWFVAALVMTADSWAELLMLLWRGLL